MKNKPESNTMPTVPSSTKRSKFLLVTILGLIMVTCLVFAGILIVRDQTSTEIPVSTPSELPTSTSKCITQGCSGTFCVDEEQVNENQLASTCEWKESYGCYDKYSTCERQGNGECGWTKNRDLDVCLKTNE